MKRIAQLPVLEIARAPRPSCPRNFHTCTAALLASVSSTTAAGPPPTAPTPSADHVDARVARRRKQAELLKRGQDLRSVAARQGGGSAKTKRFWKDVHVHRGEDGLQVHLDTRPLRRPSKAPLIIPANKPLLATALALEWDLLVSAQEALRQHLIPLTSLVSRALDIADEDGARGGSEAGPTRAGIVNTVMRYLDTDSLLCWAAEPAADPPGYETHTTRTESLRAIQQRTAQPIIAFLTERVWPGVEIVPVLEPDSIVPKSQPQMTRDVIRGWVSGLPAFELAGLERAVLAGKGLLIAARLIVEWSPELRHLLQGGGEEGGGQRPPTATERFGIEDAARAASLEVNWQTGMWGEVEDTHDVEKEDVRRQFGSVVLLVGGEEEDHV